MNVSQEKDDWKNFEKNNGTIALNVFYAKKEKYILPMFQYITQIVEKKLSFYWFQIEKDAIILQ